MVIQAERHSAHSGETISAMIPIEGHRRAKVNVSEAERKPKPSRGDMDDRGRNIVRGFVRAICVLASLCPADFAYAAENPANVVYNLSFTDYSGGPALQW